jgi:hypothetical protein
MYIIAVPEVSSEVAAGISDSVAGSRNVFVFRPPDQRSTSARRLPAEARGDGRLSLGEPFPKWFRFWLTGRGDGSVLLFEAGGSRSSWSSRPPSQLPRYGLRLDDEVDGLPAG